MTPKPSGPSSIPTEAQPTNILTPKTIEELKNSKDARNLVSWLLSEYEKSKSARLRFERKWAMNMAFYVGSQNAQFFPAQPGSAGSGKITLSPPAPSYRSRHVTNRIRPIIRTEIARLTSNKPNASVVPASSEDMDLFAAQAGEQIWQSIYNTKKLGRVFARSIFWATICGTSFTKDWWDPKAMDPVTKMEGSIQYGVVTPYHLFIPDVFEEEIEDQPYLFNVYTKSAEWVKATYGIAVNPSVTAAKSPFDTAVMNVLGSNDSKPDSVLVLEAWLKPGSHPMFPQGGYATLVNDTLVALSVDGMIFAHNEYPFTKWDHIPTGMFYSESVITDLIGPQREYNRTKGQIIEAKNRMAKPQLMAPKGSIDASKVTSEPGQIIFYRPGLAPPQPLPIQPLPAYVMEALNREVIDMEDISSQHAVSRGGAPAGITAATAISFMQERDDSLLTTAYQSVEFGWEKIARHSLSHVVQFWDMPRTVSVTGLDGSFDALVLKGTELSKGTDIRIEAGSALPVSKAAKQALLMDMMKMGFVDPQKGLELMDMGGIDKLYDELKVDERQSQRENLRMSKLEVEEIYAHEQQAQQAAMMQQQMQQQQMMQPQMPGMQPDIESPSEDTPMDMAAEGESPMGMGMQQGGAQVDPATGMPLDIPVNIIPVNTWDNHQLHIEVHNRYRKTQAFELLSDDHKRQFEAHVAMHAMVLNQAAQAAMAMPPGPDISSEMGGAQNGSGAPIGSNQFGPPGTDQGAPPPQGMMG